MTHASRLEELIIARAAAILEIYPLACKVFPLGSTVCVLSGGQMVEGKVIRHDYGGHFTIVKLSERGVVNEYPLARLLDWNPTHGLTKVND